MKKRIKSLIIKLLICSFVVGGSWTVVALSQTAAQSSECVSFSATDYYLCRFHKFFGKDSCQYVTLTAVYENETDMYPSFYSWAGKHLHFPNSVQLGDIYALPGYVVGYYTCYSNFLTGALSLRFDCEVGQVVITNPGFFEAAKEN